MLDQCDFRLRKVPAGYRVAQRVGSGWELLADVHPTKPDAVAWIKSVIGHSSGGVS